jgi:hypothetical protein
MSRRGLYEHDLPAGEAENDADTTPHLVPAPESTAPPGLPGESEVVPALPRDVPAPPPLADPATVLTKEIRDGDLAKPMEVADFMFQLGFHYRLPEKKEQTLAGSIVQVVRTRWWLPTLAVILVGIVTVIQLRPGAGASAVPRELWGEWRTQAPTYRARGFTLREGHVTLDFGDSLGAAGFPVSRVNMDSIGDTVRYEVLYYQERGLTKFVFNYMELPRPTIILPNPVGVTWLRPADSAYDAAPERLEKPRRVTLPADDPTPGSAPPP